MLRSAGPSRKKRPLGKSGKRVDNAGVIGDDGLAWSNGAQSMLNSVGRKPRREAIGSAGVVLHHSSCLTAPEAE